MKEIKKKMLKSMKTLVCIFLIQKSIGKATCFVFFFFLCVCVCGFCFFYIDILHLVLFIE